jgi:hypothetical protein
MKFLYSDTQDYVDLIDFIGDRSAPTASVTGMTFTRTR